MKSEIKMNYLFSITLLALIGFTVCEDCIDKNEEFKECGTACPVSCVNMNETGRACIALCVRGCFCKTPLVRDNTGKCVLRERCPPVPKQETCNNPNEIYKECGTACPVTCANMNETGRACIDLCVSGCFCKDPYVRDNSGKCVLKAKCAPIPKEEICNNPNETYQTCGTACPITCKNFADPPKMCIMMCKQGCFCNAPYVRDESTGKCVETIECSPIN